MEPHEPYLSPPDEPEREHPNVERQFSDSVTIRSRVGGVAMYAVYDGDTQVSKEVGPINDEEIVAFAEGYAACKTEGE